MSAQFRSLKSIKDTSVDSINFLTSQSVGVPRLSVSSSTLDAYEQEYWSLLNQLLGLYGSTDYDGDHSMDSESNVTLFRLAMTSTAIESAIRAYHSDPPSIGISKDILSLANTRDKLTSSLPSQTLKIQKLERLLARMRTESALQQRGIQKLTAGIDALTSQHKTQLRRQMSPQALQRYNQQVKEARHKRATLKAVRELVSILMVGQQLNEDEHTSERESMRAELMDILKKLSQPDTDGLIDLTN